MACMLSAVCVLSMCPHNSHMRTRKYTLSSLDEGRPNCNASPNNMSLTDTKVGKILTLLLQTMLSNRQLHVYLDPNIASMLHAAA